VPVTEVAASADDRVITGIAEFDRVLGGGLVSGSVVLLGGEPGIGKSTLLLQVMGRIAATRGVVLYVSGEESLRQMKLRAERLGVSSGGLYLLCETRLSAVLDSVAELRPGALVVDSIQTTEADAVDSAPGSVSQIRESAAEFIRLAKATDMPVLLVGHVTKEGAIAGPRVLEHMVDTVLYFEGDLHHAYRLIRATKNRYGSTNELGVFEMSDAGLREVSNPSELFLAERQAGVSGSAVVCALQGSRPLLLEVQALVSPARYGAAMRLTTGFDRNRAALLTAVLEKRGGISLENADVFVNVTGGVRLEEPAADLGVLAAMASNARDAAIDANTVFVGEVGLGGEVRSVSRAEQRLAEATKLGFQRVVLPEAQARRKGPTGKGPEVVGVRHLRGMLRMLFE
jgi:DNA repair protein RadA/Sms